MPQAEIEQPVVDVPAVGGERRPAGQQSADDDPERIDDRDAEHQQGHGHLGRAQDGERRQREAEEHHAARAGEDRGRMEVPAQEAGEGACEHEAQDRDEQLAIDPHLPANADQAEGDRGDQPDARRKAVEPVDEVDAVDHADDPDDRDNGRQQAADVDRAAERALERPNLDPERHCQDRDERLTHQLPAGTELEVVVESADQRGCRSTQQQPGELTLPDGGRQADQMLLVVDDQEGARSREKGSGDGETAGARHRNDVHPASVRTVEHPVAARQAPDRGGEREREDGGDQKGHHQEGERFDGPGEGDGDHQLSSAFSGPR